MVTVRRAVAGDAAGMAAVHVASWETTYEGILPERFLAVRTEAVRRAFWEDVLTAAEEGVCVFVACGEDGRVCGFASGGPVREAVAGKTRELYSIYLLEEAQGMGLGRALAERVMAELGAVVVWVLEANPACGFYERLGGRRVAVKQVDLGGEMFTEVAYALGED